MKTPLFAIAGRPIGPGHPAYVIAEMSGNHNGSYENALELVRAAARAGADAVKLQTYTADTITMKSSETPFRIQSGTLWDGTTLHELYQKAFTPWEWQPKLADAAKELGLHCFSSPFDETAVDFLERMHVPAYKIASFELVDIPLIQRVARTGKPMILSTGMATLAEIEEGVTAARAAGAKDLALLVCSSAYPSPPDAIRLSKIRHLSETFGVVTGLSDHTMGTEIPAAAVALGASLVEKHLCLSRSEPGPDSAFSLEPAEFAALVSAIRAAEKAVGEVGYGPTDAEKSSLQFRRSLFVVREVRRGEIFSNDNVRSIRPAHGLHTRHLPEVLGRAATADVKAGTPLSWDLVAPRTP